MITLCKVNQNGVFEFSIQQDPKTPIEPGYIVTDPPANTNVTNIWAGGWVEVVDYVPPVVVAPKNPRISRLELRRLLKPKEAQWFDDLVNNSAPLTVEERDEVFDLNTTTPELQIKAALRDALMQWNLLDQGVIEMDHPDTAEFLMILGLNGMFGAQASIRIPQILSQTPPA